MDEVTRDIRGYIPWYIHFADDVVIIDEITVCLNRKIEQWKWSLESKGFKFGSTKTKYMICGFSGGGCEDGDVKKGQIAPKSDTFRVLGSMLENNGDINEDVFHMTKRWWMKWW
jgi:hypothetical protein